MTQANKTKRPTVKQIEDLLFDEIRVLDKGFLRVVDYMGDDAAIVQSARVSYGKGTKTVSQDSALISYLIRHRHTTPFEMCEIKFHVKLPMFVARQWIRHRTANVNEYSARYSVLEDEFYFPDKCDIGYQSKHNAQGTHGTVEDEVSQKFALDLKKNTQFCYDAYKSSLDAGISRETSRITIPLNCYTQWYWKIDLHNLLHFVKLRSDHHAQHEIREYAKVMEDIIKAWVPLTYKAFKEYVKNSVTFSESGMKFLRSKINGDEKTPEEFGIGKRESKEIISALED